LACALLAIPSFGDSQVRIVRLSDVQGNVQIDRNTGQGYEKAILNMPITQGTKLRADADARAEVEFEDGSAVRIVTNTEIEFPRLSLRDSGGRASTVTLQEGTAYFNFLGTKNDEFALTFGHEKMTLTEAAHLRVVMGDTEATLAVFKGTVQVESPSGAVAVGKKQSATFDLADSDKYKLAKNLESDPYDSWDKQQSQYHDRYMSNNSGYSSPSPYGYGMSDMNYYGGYSYIPGYGMMWQPYFTSASWDPFMNGAWVYYPGFGYTWVSGYPWGWMPYRYGSWYYVPTYGWMWQPGNQGSWGGWTGTPRIINPPPRFRQPQPPTAPGNKTVIVTRGPNPKVGVSQNRMTIHNDSAGLGIPRGSIRDLGKVSQTVTQKGAVTTTIRPAPVTTSIGAQPTSAPRTATPSPRVSPPRMSPPAPAPRPAPAPHGTPHK
jgi:hypothetical protein